MLRIYLDKEALAKAGATVSSVWTGNERQFKCKVWTLNDRKMQMGDDGSIFISGLDLSGEIPSDINSFVTEVSYYDNFGYGLSPRRRIGYYRLACASAELEATGGNPRESHYQVKLRARNMSDLRELRSLILQGQIWPALDYEAEQVPPPYKHLRDLLGEMWKLVRRDVRDRLFRIRERVNG